jgi:predicted O-methyltransferase YrrM
MWRDYFYKGRIHALDIFDKSPHQEPRIKIYQGSQADKQCLESIHNETGDFDLIIDDGSHLNEHIITSFEILFPLLKKGGIYVVEDIQTAYWPTYGGQNQPGADNTAMSFFRNLADGLNYKEYLIPDYLPTFYDQHIVSLHFYHNMVVIYKGENNCPSNLVSGGVLQPH